jgi:hypothetical protein
MPSPGKWASKKAEEIETMQRASFSPPLSHKNHAGGPMRAGMKEKAASRQFGLPGSRS